MKKRTHYFFYYWLPVLLYCLLIFIQSSYSTAEEIPKLPHIDKLLHFTGYAILGVLFLRGFMNSKLKGKNKFIIMASILLTGFFGISDEFHQSYVPNRDAEIWDVFFDLLGGIFGVYIYIILLNKFPRISDI